MTYLFTADWCTQCTPVKEFIKHNDLDVKIVNVDEEHVLAGEYNIRGIPTLVVTGCDLVQHFSGAERILSFLKGIK